VRPPTAFLSYSQESPDHNVWVVQFATRLRECGVDAKLDKWEVAPGDELTHFMESSVRDSAFVLMVCTPVYKEKADRRRGGVGYEGSIISSQLYDKNDQRKFIPILRQGTWHQAFPTFLSTKLGINLVGDPYSKDEFEKLLDALLGRTPPPPPIGPASPHPPRKAAPSGALGARIAPDKRSGSRKTWLLLAILLAGGTLAFLQGPPLWNVGGEQHASVVGSALSPRDSSSAAEVDGGMVEPTPDELLANDLSRGNVTGGIVGPAVSNQLSAERSEPNPRLEIDLLNATHATQKPDRRSPTDSDLVLRSGTLRSITDLVSTDGAAIYFDPRHDLPTACPGGAVARFNGAGGMSRTAPVPCVNGKLVFQPLALPRWEDRFNSNTGHCLTFALGEQSVHYSSSLVGADEVVTPEGAIGFRIDRSVANADAPQVVLTNSPGSNGSIPCSV
jgi:hypothetical protein